MANAYVGSKVALVQFSLPGHPELPTNYREHESRPPEKNTSQEVLKLDVAFGNDLIETLTAAGLDLVDVYYQRRVSGVGAAYTVLTFLFGKVTAENLPITDDRLAVLGRHFLANCYHEVMVRKITAADGSHFFHTIFFKGNNVVNIAPERKKIIGYEGFGLAEVRSKGKSKPRNDHVVA